MPPRLRPLDIFPVHDDRGLRFHVRDQEAVQPHELILHPIVGLIALLLDGRREAAEIRQLLESRFDGLSLTDEQLAEILEELDRHYLLDTPAYRARRQELEKEYLGAPARPMIVFSKSDAASLRGLLDDLFARTGGPPQGKTGKLRGIIAPHIDYLRGGTGYAHAYRALAEGTDARRFLILGVAHTPPPTPFLLGTRAYETPFGELEVDAEFAACLRAKLDWDPTEHAFTERSEHSVELQAVLLRYLFEGPLRIVPILCGSFEDARAPRVASFVDALRQTVAEYDGEIFVISGADLSHLGPRFGDPFPVTPELVSDMEREDRASLRFVEEGDAEGFFESIRQDGNRRKICGLTSIYTFLRVVGGRGRLLHYGYAPDPAGGVVSFASLAFDA